MENTCIGIVRLLYSAMTKNTSLVRHLVVASFSCDGHSLCVMASEGLVEDLCFNF